MNYIKFILFLTIAFGISANGYTQNDFGNKTYSIPLQKNSLNTVTPATVSKFHVPAINFPPITAPPAKFPLDNNPLSSKLKRIGEKEAENFMQEKEFKNPNIIHEKRLNNQMYGEYSPESKNQYLGDFKTYSTFVKIHFWDFGEIDGDIITIYINDVPIASNIVLSGTKKVMELTLQKGFNEIVIKAINQGEVGGNTAEFEVFDESGKLIYTNMWNLATGYKAVVVAVNRS